MLVSGKVTGCVTEGTIKEGIGVAGGVETVQAVKAHKASREKKLRNLRKKMALSLLGLRISFLLS
jgi:hypothetical protein